MPPGGQETGDKSRMKFTAKLAPVLIAPGSCFGRPMTAEGVERLLWSG
jgi:hypothetical protein